jgi:hypothetical protein
MTPSFSAHRLAVSSGLASTSLRVQPQRHAISPACGVMMKLGARRAVSGFPPSKACSAAASTMNEDVRARARSASTDLQPLSGRPCRARPRASHNPSVSLARLRNANDARFGHRGGHVSRGGTGRRDLKFAGSSPQRANGRQNDGARNLRRASDDEHVPAALFSELWMNRRQRLLPK